MIIYENIIQQIAQYVYRNNRKALFCLLSLAGRLEALIQ